MERDRQTDWAGVGRGMAIVFVAQAAAIIVGLTWLSILTYLLARPDVSFGYRVATVMF